MTSNDYTDPMDCKIQPEERLQAWEQSPLQAEMSEAEMAAYAKDWEGRQAQERAELQKFLEEAMAIFGMKKTNN
jgi:hypothetical protein